MKVSEILEKSPVFSTFSSFELEKLIEKSQIKHYNRDQVIYQQGDESNRIFIVLEGIVRVFTESIENKVFIETFVFPSNSFGELALAEEHLRSQNASALVPDVKCLIIDIKTIYDLIIINPKLGFSFMKLLGKKLEYVQNRAGNLVLNDARARVVDFIKNNARQFGQQVGLEMLLKHTFTQQDIADFTGTSRQTVTTILNELKRTNKIQFRRKAMLIRDLASLS